MTDRELLELAAKAAGIRGFWVDAGLNVGSDANPIIWNPLTDDGDVFRLAVKLGIHVTNGDGYAWASNLGFDCTYPFDGDPYAATRRAIVHVAAEIERSKT